ncbi:OmpA family protein [Megalodesulfovibrio paquesii]
MRGPLLLALLAVSLGAGGCGVFSFRDETMPVRGALEGATPANPVAVNSADVDGDGIVDALDACPDTAPDQAVDARGCAVPCSFTVRVAFEPNSEDVPLSQQEKLQRLAVLLQQNPRVEATLVGQFDAPADGAAVTADASRGLLQANRRAEQVLTALVTRHGAPAARVHLQDAAQTLFQPREEELPPRRQVRQVTVFVRGTYARQGGWQALGKPFNIMFSDNTATLDEAMCRRLDLLGRQLQANPGQSATLEGHTDNVGNRQSNLALSRQRAQAVQEYLIRRWQIAPQRLAIAAAADADPLLDNSSAHGRERNRRVSVRLYQGIPSGALQARARALEQLLQDPAAAWRVQSVPQVVVHGQTPLEFGKDDTTITPEMARRLESIGSMLAARPELRAIVQGHCDKFGNPQLEQLLARKRAEAVCRLLMQRYHIAPDRLDVRSFGADVPVANNGTEEGRQRNRRVELRIVTGQ